MLDLCIVNVKVNSGSCRLHRKVSYILYEYIYVRFFWYFLHTEQCTQVLLQKKLKRLCLRYWDPFGSRTLTSCPVWKRNKNILITGWPSVLLWTATPSWNYSCLTLFNMGSLGMDVLGMWWFLSQSVFHQLFKIENCKKIMHTCIINMALQKFKIYLF